jgi:hypothetical protein
MLDNISEITKSTLKNLEEKAFNPDNSISDSNLDYSSIKLPLNNNPELNYIITETNLGINENLNNIIFFEFDLNSSNITKEHVKCFKEINNDFVEKEIHFVLNVIILYNIITF